MKNKLIFVISITFLFAQAPNVSNVIFAQRTDGSGLVDIYYDLSDTDDDSLSVTLKVSNDAGSTWGFSCTEISGEVGANIQPGTAKQIVWDFGAEHSNIYSNQIIVRITADEANTISGFCVDIDGNEYATVIIGNQVWMSENLKVTKYRDGTAIPTGLSNSEWENTTSGAYAVYDNNETHADTYGYLYNWYAVDDSRNIAPDGWHVPTDDEWTTLTDYLGGTSVAGGKMKETGTSHWNSPNTGATNESGFTAFPGGYRNDGDGNYNVIGSYGYFWSSSESGSNNAWKRDLYYNNSGVYRYDDDKNYGFSVRCVRD
jgi:uncharacterized protein (TIGR02145 family)